MPQITINNCAGRFVQQNSFTTPDGAFEKLLNVNCVKDQMAISRRGFDKKVDAEVFRRGNAMVEYLDRIFISEADRLQLVSADRLGVAQFADTDSLWSIAAGTRPYFTKANGNLYATTASGVLKVESLVANIMKSGIAKGLDLNIEALITGGSDLFPIDSQVGYRCLFGRLDANNNKVIGAPTEFAIASNPYINDAAATAAGTTITVTSTAHGLTNGDLITTTDGKDSAGTAQAMLNRTATAITYINANSFSFVASSAPGGVAPYTVDWGVEKNLGLQFTIPTDCLSTEFFYQVYRTDFTSAATVDPLESTLQLVYEANLTALEISVGVVQFSDTVDAIFKGAYLYTNPNTGEGIAQANDPPPFADDIAQFSNMVLYANTKTKHQLSLDLVSVSNLVGNILRFDFSDATARQYTGNTVSGVVDFVVTSTGTTSQNIAATARSLCETINQDPFSKVVAYYVSDVGGVPGKMIFEAKEFDISFELSVVSAVISDNFQPIVPELATDALDSTNADEPNAIYVSKVNEPEAVPALNKFYVGPKTSEILRIVPLRETLLVITEVGVYGVRGDSPGGLAVQLIDNTVICKAKNSVQVVNNECYFLSNQGVVACSETSVRVVSRQIEPLLTSIFGNPYYEQFTSAIGYESEHLYILGTLAPNTSPVELSETPTTALIDSDGFAFVTFSTAVSSVVVGDSVVVSGFSGALSALNGTFPVVDIDDDTIQFWVDGAATGSASAVGTEFSSIAQNEVHVYNIVSNRWSHWDSYFIDGVVASTDDKLLLIHPYELLGVERKNFNNLDYCDESTTVAILVVASDGLSCTVDLSPTTDGLRCEAGDALVVDGVVYTCDTATPVDATTDEVTFRTAVNFDDGASATLYKSIDHDIITAPLTAGDVSRWKFYSEFQAAFRTQSCRNVEVSFIGNSASESTAETWESEVLSGWGQLPFGQFAFGLGDSTNLVLTTDPAENVRVIVPKSHARSSWIKARLRHRRASEAFDMQSFSYRTRAYGPRVGA